MDLEIMTNKISSTGETILVNGFMTIQLLL